MIRTRDFRPDATNLSRIVNARARRENRPKVVELDTDEFVHIHCDDVVFIVFRDVITAGSMYFDSCLFGFFKEAYSQEITFAQDICPDALELYLNLTHSWFFEIIFRGIRVVPVDYFRSLIEAIQEEPFRKAHLEIPKLKLRELAEVVTLADRFLHRSLLCILRQMFLSLLNITHVSWGNLKQEARDMDVLYHAEFVFDYTDTFEILSMGHDDEKYLRNALTESFHWINLNTPDIRDRFLYLMSDDFIAECDQDRHGHSETEQFSHAKGIFATDQFCYESVTRVQKQRRFKRVVNMCPFEDQKDIFPWVENPQDRRIRVRRLHNSVRAVKRSARNARNLGHQLDSVVLGVTTFHQASTVHSYNQLPAYGGELGHDNIHIRGSGRGRGHGRGRGRGIGAGEHRLSRDGYRQRSTTTMNHGSRPKTLKVDPKGDKVPRTDDRSLLPNYDLQSSVATKLTLPSNEATDRSNVDLNLQAQAFERPLQMDSMISSIRVQVSNGTNDTLGYLKKQGKHAVHHQHRGQLQDNEGRSNQVIQPRQSCTPKTQKIYAQQPPPQQIAGKDRQDSSQNPSKPKKKKSRQASATARNTEKPTSDIITLPLPNKHQTKNTSQALKCGNANTGSVDVARDDKSGVASTSAASEASGPTVQLPNKVKIQLGGEDRDCDKVNSEKGRSRRYRKGHGHAREKAQGQT